MTTPTPADELAAAAEKIRALATGATPAPWNQTGIGEYGWGVSFSRPGSGVEAEDSDQGRADADFIAAMHPGVGTTLADWLDSMAMRVRRDGDEWVGADLHHALAVARALLARPAAEGVQR